MWESWILNHEFWSIVKVNRNQGHDKLRRKAKSHDRWHWVMASEGGITLLELG